MSIRDYYHSGYSLEVLGQEWYLSVRGMEALDVDGFISEAILRTCAMELGR